MCYQDEKSWDIAEKTTGVFYESVFILSIDRLITTWSLVQVQLCPPLNNSYVRWWTYFLFLEKNIGIEKEKINFIR